MLFKSGHGARVPRAVKNPPQPPTYYSRNNGKNYQDIHVKAPSHSGLVSGLLGGVL